MSVQFTCEVLSGRNLPTFEEKTSVGFRFTDENEEKKNISSELIEFSEGEITLKHEFEKEVNEIFINDILSGDMKILEIVFFRGKNEELGSKFIDFTPFVFDKKEISQWHSIQLKEVKKKKRKKTAKGKKKDKKLDEEDEPIPTPELKVKITLSDALISAQNKENGNFLTIKVDRMENIPETLHPKTTMESYLFDYRVGFDIPINETEKKRYYIGGGNMKAEKMEKKEGEEEGEKEKKEERVKTGKKEPSKEKENMKYSVEWKPKSKVFFLSRAGIEKLEKIFVHSEKFEVEVTREIKSEKYVDGYEDMNYMKYTGKVDVPVTTLMNPGVSTVKGEYGVENSKKESEEEKKEKKKKPKKKGYPPELLPEDDDVSFPYEKAGSRLFLALALQKPIIVLPKDRKRTKMTPKDLIPPRKEMVKKIDPVELFERETEKITEILVEEYEALKKKLGKDVLTKEEFVFELNSGGVYFGFKEKLKKTILQLIKENFATELNLSEDEERNKIFNEIYVYLIKQMHVVVNRIFDRSMEMKRDVGQIEGDKSEKLKRFADEAEIEKNYQLASNCHRERVSYNSKNPGMWAEYALFCFKTRDYEKSEECFKEALKLEMTHVPSLHAYGTLLCCLEKFKEAEVYFQSAIDIDEEDVLSWNLLHMYYDVVEDENQKHQAFLMAKRLNEKKKGTVPLRILLAKYLIELNVHKITEGVLLQEAKESKSFDLYYYFAKMYFIRENFKMAEENLKLALAKDHTSVAGWTLFGHIYYEQGRMSDAQQSYERAVSISKEDKDPLLLLRLASIYLEQEKYEDSKVTYLDAAKIWPVGISWLGVGISYYRLNDYENAEQALNEANIQNNTNPKNWAYLALVCLKKNLIKDAERCLREAVRNNLEDKELLNEVNVNFEEKKEEKSSIVK